MMRAGLLLWGIIMYLGDGRGNRLHSPPPLPTRAAQRPTRATVGNYMWQRAGLTPGHYEEKHEVEKAELYFPRHGSGVETIARLALFRCAPVYQMLHSKD